MNEPLPLCMMPTVPRALAELAAPTPAAGGAPSVIRPISADALDKLEAQQREWKQSGEANHQILPQTVDRLLEVARAYLACTSGQPAARPENT